MTEVLESAESNGKMRPALSGAKGLPPGVCQSDCEGPPDPLAHANDRQLWSACTDTQKQFIAEAFLGGRPETVRDAILESQETDGPVSLGKILWQSWLDYRGSALGRLHSRGELVRR
ncbi:MAG: hypothetical protein ABSG31_15905 [Tepidisphaeraceae bacterium]|jgi:hypothetical protein